MTFPMGLADRVGEAVSAAAGQVVQLDGRWVAVALGLQLLVIVFRSLSWRGALQAAYPERRLPLFSIGCAYAAGAAANAFIPARGGEAVKVALVRTQVPGSTLPTIGASLAVVLVVDALIGAALVGTLFALGVLPTLPPLPVTQLAPVVGGLALVGVVAATVLLRRWPDAVRSVLSRALQGLAVLRSPRACLGQVVPFQLAAWACRIGVTFFVLHAFHIDAGLEAAALVVVLNGASTAVPVPGGAGTQQVLATFALQGLVTAAAAVTFSLGLQVGITAVNTAVGLAAMMLLFRTLRPGTALRSARAAVAD